MFNVGIPKSGPRVKLETARAAREERVLKRLQEQAASKIQRYARGFLSRRTISKKWRKEFDNIVGWKGQSHEQKLKTNSCGPCEKARNDIRSSTLDKINPTNKKLSTQQWQFASFGSNTLTGVYSNFSNSPRVTNNVTVREMASDRTNQDMAVCSRVDEQHHMEDTTTPSMCDIGSIDPNNGAMEEISRNATAVEIYQAIQKFLFFFNLQKDEMRFLQLCKFLSKNIELESSHKMSYAALSIHKHYVLDWIRQVKRVLWIACRYIDALRLRSHKDTATVSIYLKLVLFLTDLSHWKSLQKQKVLHSALAQICFSTICDLQQRGCMRVVGSLLLRDITDMSGESLHHCFLILMRQVFASHFNDESIISFVLEVLTVPSLIWQLRVKAPQCLTIFEQNDMLLHILTLFHVENACPHHGLTAAGSESSQCVIRALCVFANLVQLLVLDNATLCSHTKKAVALMNQLLAYLYVNTAQQNTATSTWHPVLGYFTQTVVDYADAMQYVKLQLEFLWKPEFVRAVFHDVLTLQSLHDEMAVPTQAEQIVAKQSSSKTRLSSKLSNYLKRIVSSRPDSVLLPTGGRKLEYEEVKNTCAACILYRKALAIFTRHLQLEMLTGLTFMDDVLCRLWRFICELGPAGGLELFLTALTLPPNVAEPYFAVFTLFCDMTAHILSILDEVEFYEQQVPFHLEEHLTISAFLRQFVFRVIWSRLVVDTSSPMYPVFDSAHSLLMMLYNRDARRPFTPSSHWLCKDVKSSTIRSELESGQARAKLILEKIPFVIPHKDRVVYFQSLVRADRSKLGIAEDNEVSAYIRIHRSRLVSDGFEQLNNLPINSLKGTIRVKFVNDLGLDEAGIDQDGVFKEFLEEIVRRVFNPDMNLFRVTQGEEAAKLYPSPLSHMQDDHLMLFNFVGRMLAKAVYEGIVLDIPFANFFLRHLLGHKHTALYSPIDELPSLDAQFYKNLTWVKRYEGDISDLGLTFTYEEDMMGRIESHDLVPDGASIAVTNENRFMYVHTLAHYRLHTQIKDQTCAFVQGFRSLIARNWTAMFSAPELQRLISGDNIDMDLTDLKRHVVYYGGFHSSHRVVRWLWDVLERDYTAAERSAFLKFVTSCSRPPLLGFAHLQPMFSIRCVEVSEDEDTGDTVATVLRGFLRLPSSKSRRSQHHPHRLPTASTCFNLLKLPNYPSKDVLRDKLKQAISNNTGFELS